MVLIEIGCQLSLDLSDDGQDPGLKIFIAVRSNDEIDLVRVRISRALSRKSEDCVFRRKRDFVEDG